MKSAQSVLKKALPLVAILRGVRPDEVCAIGHELVDAGFDIIEVPLNSQDAFRSIELLSNQFGNQVTCGAGTVTSTQQVHDVSQAGGKIIVSPNTDIDVISTSKQLDMISLPGCMTPSEAFHAIAAGADGLKFFPAEAIPPSTLKAMKVTLPSAVPLFAVGGVNDNNMLAYLNAGAHGFGIGSSLYKPNKPLTEIRQSANNIVKAYHAAHQQHLQEHS
ncbi:MAG: 2-dehydro-3-deoxy-6-phosphogalactonate aldolase [Cellvibrionaceae bacterium]|nr:2-dehydro-3-deoxy-6-phosphogalactonate aldolase [Cellvibrionaceae bacterium]